MNLQTDKPKLYEFLSTTRGGQGYKIVKNRVMIGSSEICDIKVDSSSSIHGVLEISDNQCRIFDLNSATGIFVNGEKVVSQIIELGDIISIGEEKFEFTEYREKDIPPPLSMLSPLKLTKKAVVHKKLPTFIKHDRFEQNPTEELGGSVVPRVEYPLENDNLADSVEYIFEDSNNLYPIFNYEQNYSSIEVIILFKNKIHSIDYLPNKKGTFYLRGFGSSVDDIELSYLGKNEKIPFIHIDGEVTVNNIPGYKQYNMGSSVENTQNSNLLKNDLLFFKKEEVQIFVKQTDAPPKVATAPILRRDPEFRKFLFISLFISMLFLVLVSSFKVDKQIEKEKAPLRLATVLYRKHIMRKVPRKIIKAKVIPKKIAKVKVKVHKVKAHKVKVHKVKQHKLKMHKIVSKKTNTKKIVRKRVSRPSHKATSHRNHVKKTSGAVDTFKSFDFKSSISGALSKGGTKSKFNMRNLKDSSGSEVNNSLSNKKLHLAKVSKDIGGLKSSSRVKLDSKTGVEGLVQKKNIYTEGVPYKTVILGGIDPNIILQKLIEHIPQFRYCYQRQLDITKKVFNGLVGLNFVIGASGYVSRANVKSASGSHLPRSVQKCVVNVLRGIDFPEPRGGGVVEVRQPMNFFAKVSR